MGLRGLSASTGPGSTGADIQQGAAVAISAGTSIGAAAAAGTSLTIPIIGAALAAVALGINLILNSGCGQTCVITSNWANLAEGKLEQNLSEYFAIPAPRPQSAQTAALQNFDSVWNYLYSQCSSAQVGDAGVKCITDRQSGACTWKQTSSSTLLQYPGEPQPGECWNWFNGYRDPIANDPVISDAQYEANLQAAQGGTSTTSTTGSTATSSSSSILSGTSNTSLLLIAGAALLLFGAMGSNQ